MYIRLRKTNTTTFQKTLSLRGKAILLNTLILSKVTFLSNIFPISTQTLKQIEKHIFKHIWQFSNWEPIARKTLFLPKTQAGIGLIEPKYHCLVETGTFSHTERRTKPRKLDFICKTYVSNHTIYTTQRFPICDF